VRQLWIKPLHAHCIGQFLTFRFAFAATAPHKATMTADEFRKFESALIAAEDLFVGQYVYGARTIEIRNDFKALLTKVVAERIRSEAREQESPDGNRSLKAESDSPSSTSRLLALERSVTVFEEVARNFERAHERMRANRRGASDSMMVNFDELISANQQSLVSVLRILATTKGELEHERRRSTRE
jgi:hypothetical protein